MVMMNVRPSAPPSNLTDSWHPAYLLHISEEVTPQDWQMHAKSPTMWRWHFAVWENPSTMPQEPEIQSGLTSTKFSPKGRYQASKAYPWACAILGRVIPSGETIDYDPLYPLPCRIKTIKEPGKDFIKIIDVESWVEGAQALPSIRNALLQLRQQVVQQPPPVIPPVAPPVQVPPAVQGPASVAPGMQTWVTVTTPPAKPTW